jgi:DNA-directed RNA polymerase subunit M/transcription elongation factor TFIIS
MDVTFFCPTCKQELEADVSLTGTEIQCPSCNASITIPEPDVQNVKVMNPIASSAAAREEKHFSVPLHEGPSEVLVKKPVAKKDVVPQDGRKHLRCRTIRRIDCVELGHDRFDEIVTQFLDKVGDENFISLGTVAYTYIDIGSQKLLTDFGVLIVYRG